MSIRRWKNVPACAAVAGILGLLQGCVSTEAFLALEQRSRILEAEVARGRQEQAAVRSGLADLEADLMEVRAEVQQLRGQLSLREFQEEETARTGESVEESLLLQVSHLQQEIRSMEGRLGRVEDFFGLKRPEAETRGLKRAEAPAVPPPPATPPGVRTPGGPAVHEDRDRPLDPEEAYQAAYRLFRSSRYENARDAFRRFMEMYPHSTLVDNAMFWIAETHYITEDYPTAILLYQQVLEQYPNGSKVPDSLLKMGYALERIGEPQAAIAALNRLLKEHPDSRQAGWARTKILQLTSAETDARKDRGNETEQNPEASAPEDKPPN